jgi:hypothetical protein
MTKKQLIKIGDYILDVQKNGFSLWSVDAKKPSRWFIDASDIRESGIIRLNTKNRDIPRFCLYFVLCSLWKIVAIGHK